MKVLLVLLCMLGAAPLAHAQAYPSKPVHMVVGFPPGGGTDILARIVAQRLGEKWGQQVVVENRPGASATIASGVVAHAPPDGYTISMGQLTPISYASSGPGSLQHLAAELFRTSAGIEMLHVPYKGSGQAVVDVMSGQVDMNFDSIPATLTHIQSGKLRAIAVTGAKRAGGGLENIPTIAESGYAGYDLTTWWGVFVPAGTPPDVLKRIHDDTVAVLAIPEVRERFAGLSVEPGGGTSAEFADYVRAEIGKYDRLVKQLGIHVE